VVNHGAINVFNQCAGGQCEGTDNFWRSLSDLTLMSTCPRRRRITRRTRVIRMGPAAKNSADIWAVSQAAPMRNVIIQRQPVLQDYCGGSAARPTTTSAAATMANDEVTGPWISTGSSSTSFAHSDIGSSSNYVSGTWCFMGVKRRAGRHFGVDGGQYTNVASSPVSEEEPYLYTNDTGSMRVFVPAVQHNSVGRLTPRVRRPASRFRSRGSSSRIRVTPVRAESTPSSLAGATSS